MDFLPHLYEQLLGKSREIRRSVAALIRQNKINGIIFSLVIPTLIGIFVAYYDKLSAINPALFWIPVAFFTVLAFVAAYITYEVKLAPEVYNELEEAGSIIKNLSDHIVFLSDLQEYIFVWNAIVREHTKSTILSPNQATDKSQNLKSVLSAIFDIVVEEREELFGFLHREIWTVVLYIAHPTTDELYPVSWTRSRRHPSGGAPRRWSTGCGHVGVAYAQATAKICADSRAPNVWEAFSSGVDRSYDRDIYRSFASQPIGPVATVSKPYGVLIATSNRPGRFNVASGLALRHATDAMASIIYLTYDENDLKQICSDSM